MEQREKLLEEREHLKREYTKRLEIWMDAFHKRDELLPKSHDPPGGVEMATFTLTRENLAEYDNAEKEEREASAKLREALERMWEINTRLQT